MKINALATFLRHWIASVLLPGFALSQNVTIDVEEPLEITLPETQAADIRVRDPFILAEPETGVYILYAQKGNRLGGQQGPPGVEAYLSRDLATWRGPIVVLEIPDPYWARKMVWAPEVHKYREAYYLLVTLTSDDTLATASLSPSRPTQNRRGTQIFKSDSPLGPFVDFRNGPSTPPNWMAVDGTFFTEDGTPFMVFCHEWTQVHDGTVELMELKTDLSGPAGDPVTLFKASEAAWVRNLADAGYASDGLVTDGTFLHQTSDGKLFMIWSSFGDFSYAIGLAQSESGKLRGPWKQFKDPVYPKDGGHGMIFTTLEDKEMMVLHKPNESPHERMVFYELVENDGKIGLKP